MSATRVHAATALCACVRGPGLGTRALGEVWELEKTLVPAAAAACLPDCLPACACLPPACLPTCLPAHLPARLPACLPACLPARCLPAGLASFRGVAPPPPPPFGMCAI